MLATLASALISTPALATANPCAHCGLALLGEGQVWTPEGERIPDFGFGKQRFAGRRVLKPAHQLLKINIDFLALGMLLEAVDQYRQALQLDSNDAVSHNNLGQALLRLGHTRDALLHFRESLRIDPSYAEPYYNMGVTLAGTGDVPGAISALRRAVQLKPDWAPPQFELSQLLELRH